jgi:hypothetical protein
VFTLNRECCTYKTSDNGPSAWWSVLNPIVALGQWSFLNAPFGRKEDRFSALKLHTIASIQVLQVLSPLLDFNECS